MDSYETVFGIRTIKFDAARGLLVNGEPVEIKGVCNHHDLGALGAAVNLRALERQLEILKEMGVNAIRTSHNPPAPELLDLADRMGFLVMDEAFDAWRRSKKKNDYHLLFDDWHEKDLRALVRRDRNHPSVIVWSTGNEIGEQGTPEGHKLSQRLTDIVRDEDPTRPVTAGANNVNAGYNGFQKTLDVFGYNYKPQEYGKFREKNPAVPLYGSETSSTRQLARRILLPRRGGEGQGEGRLSGQLLRPLRAALGDDARRGVQGSGRESLRRRASSSGRASTTSASRRPTTPTRPTCSTSPTRPRRRA